MYNATAIQYRKRPMLTYYRQACERRQAERHILSKPHFARRSRTVQTTLLTAVQPHFCNSREAVHSGQAVTPPL